MNFLRAFLLGGLVAASPLWAVYAPIPEQEQGKDLTINAKAGISYDSNLFGAATDTVGSAIWELAPRIAYNASVTDQTFLSASYRLTLDYFDNRPGDKLLDSHDVSLRVAHAFSKSTNIDVNEVFMISRNPESLLAGIPLSPDQSFTRNQLDGRFVTPVTAKIGVVFKARTVYYHYRNAVLGRSLDRTENLYGVAGEYAVLPELKGVAEYRRQDVFYRKLGETKNKSSDFVLGGVDYVVAQKVTLTSRFGFEARRRSAERDTMLPYAEVSAKYDYTETSFLTGGYAYSFDETSDTARFTDSKIHRLFVNVQHSITALIVASGSLGYEPSQLQGRRGQASVDEATTRAGLALSYLPTKNWTISASADYDRIRSDDAVRNMRRNRVGLSANYTF
ncbi:MAG: outer membrane beta-barrel protein [Verrucomicrobia bacterium]|nr:outer membrane beta-barrel protein [Verrucomicrobiota bacterium]